MSEKVTIRFLDHPDVGDIAAAIGDCILDVAHAHGVDLDHACGGACACSTCHIKVLDGAKALNETSEDEEDQLDEARDVDLTSRLGCQTRIERLPEGGVLEIRIPKWNTNLIKEGH